jgi:hypothetical protein
VLACWTPIIGIDNARAQTRSDRRVRHIADTIGVSIRSAATFFAVRHGLLKPPTAVASSH